MQPLASKRKRLPWLAFPTDTAGCSGPATPLVTFASVRLATALVMPSLSRNLTGIALPSLKLEVPSFLMGGSKPNQWNRTCTVKVAVALLPEASTAEQVTVVVPSGKWLPEAGTHVTGII